MNDEKQSAQNPVSEAKHLHWQKVSVAMTRFGIASAQQFCNQWLGRRRCFPVATVFFSWHGVVLVTLAACATFATAQRQASCLSDPQLNEEFEIVNGGPIPHQDSCCMMDVCGLTCPKETAPPNSGTF
jgi:hypothetical protein